MSNVVAFPRPHAAPGGQVCVFPVTAGGKGWDLVQVQRNNLCVRLRTFRNRDDALIAGPAWAAHLGAIFDTTTPNMEAPHERA